MAGGEGSPPCPPCPVRNKHTALTRACRPPTPPPRHRSSPASARTRGPAPLGAPTAAWGEPAQQGRGPQGAPGPGARLQANNPGAYPMTAAPLARPAKQPPRREKQPRQPPPPRTQAALAGGGTGSSGSLGLSCCSSTSEPQPSRPVPAAPPAAAHASEEPHPLEQSLEQRAASLGWARKQKQGARKVAQVGGRRGGGGGLGALVGLRGRAVSVCTPGSTPACACTHAHGRVLAHVPVCTWAPSYLRAAACPCLYALCA